MCQTPSEDSRCSSSMGYLEPRPPNHPPPSTEAEGQVPSPKDIQKKLMEKVASLQPPDGHTEPEEEGEGEEEGAESASISVCTITSSHSSHSLNSSGSTSSRGVSFSFLFRSR